MCWGDRNRSVLVRVPLGWTTTTDMSSVANPLSEAAPVDPAEKQTVEIRCPDGSADIYQLLAGLAVAARHGFEMDNALDVAERTYVNVNIHDEANAAKLESLEQLPVNCSESADQLLAKRAIYERYGVFSPRMIEGIAEKLRAYDDSTLAERAKADDVLMRHLVDKYFYCG